MITFDVTKRFILRFKNTLRPFRRFSKVPV